MKFLPYLLTASILHAEPSPVLGKIGEIEINTEEIREAIAGLEASQGTAVSQDPAALNQYVRALLVQRLVLQQALETKLDQDPAVIAKLVRARESALTELYLESVSAPDPAYPTEEELQSAYETAKPGLVAPKAYRLAQIFIASPKDGERTVQDQAKARLDAAVKRLKAKDASFAEIARSVSEEPTSAANGGEIGWLAESQLQPEIRELLPKLKRESVSEPVRLENGWHILRLLDVREPHTPPLEQVRESLIARLRAERALQNRKEFLASLIDRHPIAINEIELGKIAPKAAH